MNATKLWQTAILALAGCSQAVEVKPAKENNPASKVKLVAKVTNTSPNKLTKIKGDSSYLL